MAGEDAVSGINPANELCQHFFVAQLVHVEVSSDQVRIRGYCGLLHCPK
jgi:hypothetical protein